jgi:valyl-tRNA synthetase
LEGVVDSGAERERLGRAIEEAERLFGQSSGKLSNPQFLERAPAGVVAKEQAKAAEAAERISRLRAQLESLG